MSAKLPDGCRVITAHDKTGNVIVPRHLARHMEWCVQKTLSPNTIYNRRRYLLRLSEYLGHDCDDATEPELEQWYVQLTARVTPAHRAVYLSNVNAYYEWLVRERLRDDNPALRLMRPRLNRRLPRPIPTADLAEAIDLADERVRPWLVLAAYGGLRAIEIANLRAELVDFNTKRMTVTGKGNKERTLPMHPEVEHALRTLDPPMPRSGFVFRHWDQEGPPKAYSVSHACCRHLHSVGIDSTLHSLRHWFGTNVYRNTQDLRLTQELMGHGSPITTSGYAAHSDEKSHAAVVSLRVQTD